MAYSNSARQLVQITAGVDYTKPATWSIGTTYAKGAKVSLDGTNYVSLANANVGHNPSTKQTWWALQPQTASIQAPIFGLLCTGKTGAGDVVLRAIDDTSDTTIPNTAFVVGVCYPIYLAKLVSAPAGTTFIGFRG